jgi:hypothetical protein
VDEAAEPAGVDPGPGEESHRGLDGWEGTRDVAYFTYEDGSLRTTFDVRSDLVPAFQEIVRELAEWRLAEYLDRAGKQTAGHATLKVSHANGQPILFLPPPPERHDLPEGWTDVEADGETLSANFVKIAINVARRGGETTNVLSEVLRRWFGEDAGGSWHEAFGRTGAGWFSVAVDSDRHSKGSPPVLA